MLEVSDKLFHFASSKRDEVTHVNDSEGKESADKAVETLIIHNIRPRTLKCWDDDASLREREDFYKRDC